MCPNHLGDLVADAVDRIQRGHRILEHHRDLLAAHVAQLVVVEAVQLTVAVRDRPGDPGVGCPRQPGECLRRNAFARAGLADDGQHLAGLQLERDTADRQHDAVLGGETYLEVVDLEDGGHAGAASPSRIRGSSTAYAKSTIVLNSTMKNAPKSVTPISGGRSRLRIASPAYSPTPLRLYTVSVRIAPPPTTCPKSRPNNVTIGIIELRSTWRMRTWRSESPFARAVRT